ncbi:hypothetical protein B0T19DRAFT_234393 [Cercophora scortea]|uniref:Uncharacterized protein n=1 Tax=Cercophora scortea TaxID=314031 RepID=A0AAE0MAK4_9PEZI|nr:hypothetical protein B0T19DRAFT_234393 [Cercophora scortea]
MTSWRTVIGPPRTSGFEAVAEVAEERRGRILQPRANHLERWLGRLAPWTYSWLTFSALGTICNERGIWPEEPRTGSGQKPGANVWSTPSIIERRLTRHACLPMPSDASTHDIWGLCISPEVMGGVRLALINGVIYSVTRIGHQGRPPSRGYARPT